MSQIHEKGELFQGYRGRREMEEESERPQC